jgi:hypothetical protein
MNHFKHAGLALVLCTVLALGNAWAAHHESHGFDLNRIGTYKIGDSRAELSVLEASVTDALKVPAHRKHAADSLTAFLSTNATSDAKQFVCRLLAVCADERNVPGIAKLLYSADTADMARIALQPIPGDAADKALIAALKDVDDATKIGIVNTLGERGSSKSVSTLGKLAKSENDELAASAAAALGKIGTTGAARRLNSAKRKADGARRLAISEAQLVCAEHCVTAGRASSAKKIYEALASDEESKPIQRAAQIGLDNLSE